MYVKFEANLHGEGFGILNKTLNDTIMDIVIRLPRFATLFAIIETKFRY